MAIPEIFAQTQGSILWQLIHYGSEIKTWIFLNFLREDISIHRTNLKYCGKSPKIRFLSYFHSL